MIYLNASGAAIARPRGPTDASAPSPGILSELAIVQRERDRLEDENAELRGAARDAIAAPSLERAREILRRALR